MGVIQDSMGQYDFYLWVQRIPPGDERFRASTRPATILLRRWGIFGNLRAKPKKGLYHPFLSIVRFIELQISFHKWPWASFQGLEGTLPWSVLLRSNYTTYCPHVWTKEVANIEAVSMGYEGLHMNMFPYSADWARGGWEGTGGSPQLRFGVGANSSYDIMFGYRTPICLRI